MDEMKKGRMTAFHAVAAFSSVLCLLALFLTFSASTSEGSDCRREVPAEEILTKIKMNDPANYENVTIVGSFDLTDMFIDSDIKIRNSCVDELNFTSSTFKKPAEFANCTFRGQADLSKAKFLDAASFEDSTFEQNASFSEAEFGDAIFKNARFPGTSDFDYAKFGGYTCFSGSDLTNSSFSEVEFKGPAEFGSSRFNGTADFLKAHFFDLTNFKGAVFGGDANFASAKFDDVAAFTSARFQDNASFKLARFARATHFGATNFTKDAIFQLSAFDNLAYFIGARFGGNLDLMGSKIFNIKLENTTFAKGSEITLKDADFTKFQTHWSHINKNLAYDGAAYLRLVKNYKDLEWFSDSDDCYYQYRMQSQALKSWGSSKIVDILACTTCGYGVRPIQPIICSVILILGCTTVFWMGNGLRHSTNKEKRTSLYDALYYCLAIFFTIPLPDLKPAGRYRYVPVILRAIAWTLFALLIATLGKVMIR